MVRVLSGAQVEGKAVEKTLAASKVPQLDLDVRVASLGHRWQLYVDTQEEE